MTPGWLSVLPPLMALTLAFLTRKIITSLLVGITIAALIAHNFSPLDAIKGALTHLVAAAELDIFWQARTIMQGDKIFIFFFLTFLAIVVTLISFSGGAYAYAAMCRNRVSDSRATENSSLFLSLLLFIDDYFSLLTVGSVMQQLTDRFRVPRVKLAYITESMGAPLCSLFPISSWGAAIISQLVSVGINEIPSKSVIVMDPFIACLTAIPFTFHPWLVIAAVFFVVNRRISFGTIGKHERIAQQTGNLFGGKPPLPQRVRDVSERNVANASLIDFIVPIVMLLGCGILAILYTGNAWVTGGSNDLFTAIKQANSALGLCLGSLIALVITTILFYVRNKVHARDLPALFWDGAGIMLPTIRMLILAWTFGNFLRLDLHTGDYIASLIPHGMPLGLIPVLFFIVSAVTTFSIGSAWGTMAIMFPIAIPMLLSLLQVTTPISASIIPLLFPTIGAIISGSVLGDHVSPIADVTVMASGSAGCYHMDFIYAQAAYIIPVAIGSCTASLIAGLLLHKGLLISSLVAMVSGLFIAFSMLTLLNSFSKRFMHKEQPL